MTFEEAMAKLIAEGAEYPYRFFYEAGKDATLEHPPADRDTQ